MGGGEKWDEKRGTMKMKGAILFSLAYDLVFLEFLNINPPRIVRSSSSSKTVKSHNFFVSLGRIHFSTFHSLLTLVAALSYTVIVQ